MTIETAPLTTLGAAAAAVIEDVSSKREPLVEDGVYFGMPESIYYADPALGSSALKSLAENPCEYWYETPYNEFRADEETTSQAFGTAMHKCVLEGEEAFRARYAPVYQPGNIKAGKDERNIIMASGLIPIKFDEWRRILMGGATIRANEELADAFEGGAPEATIFWTDELGIRKRARIDYLKTRASVDLKTIANQYKINFPAACRGAIKSYRYDVQVAHYNDGRAQMRRLAQEGRVFGDHDADWFKRVIASETWATVIVFIQSQRSPLVWSTMFSPGNPMLDVARVSIMKAEENFLKFRDRFGMQTPWVLTDPIEEISIDEMPFGYGRN